MKFGFIAKHRSVWPVPWLCEALGVSRSGFHAWLKRGPCARSREDEAITPAVRASFVASARTYGAPTMSATAPPVRPASVRRPVAQDHVTLALARLSAPAAVFVSFA